MELNGRFVIKSLLIGTLRSSQQWSYCLYSKLFLSQRDSISLLVNPLISQHEERFGRITSHSFAVFFCLQDKENNFASFQKSHEQGKYMYRAEETIYTSFWIKLHLKFFLKAD